MIRAPVSVGTVALVAFVLPVHASNLLTNGSFDQNAPASGCTAGATTLYGWTVTAGNIDIDSAACSGIPAADGGIWIDLTGSYAESGINDVGTIKQSVATKVGAEYSLSFYFGANPQAQQFSYPNDSLIKSMNVLLNGAVLANYTLNTAGVAADNPQWAYETLYFKAKSASTEIGFASLNGITSASDFGPLLDGVSLQRVPEPSTIALVIPGIAVLAFSLRKRRAIRPVGIRLG